MSQTTSKCGCKTEWWCDGKYSHHQQEIPMWSVRKISGILFLCSALTDFSFLCRTFPFWGISNRYQIIPIPFFFTCLEQFIVPHLLRGFSSQFMKTKMISPLLNSYRVWKADCTQLQYTGRQRTEAGKKLQKARYCTCQLQRPSSTVIKESYFRQIFSAVQHGKHLY